MPRFRELPLTPFDPFAPMRPLVPAQTHCAPASAPWDAYLPNDPIERAALIERARMRRAFHRYAMED
jgi:hypothetical protein